MSKQNNSHLKNFVSLASDRFAIVDATNEFNGTKFWEIASGKTIAEAKERFYNRFMFRADIDREMMMNAQRHNRLKIQKIEANKRILIESDVTLLAY